MTEKANSKKGKPTAESMDFGCRPPKMTPLDGEARLNTLKPPAMTPIRMQVNDALKPAAMTPLRVSGEDRGLKPGSMTPNPQPAPAQPVNAPARPKKK